jgi:hypothetical protein
MKLFSHYGKLYTGSWDNSIICWNTSKKAHSILRQFCIHDGSITSFAMQPNLANLYSLGHDCKINVINTKKNLLEKSFTGFYSNGQKNSFAVSQKSQIIYGISEALQERHLLKIVNVRKGFKQYVYTDAVSIHCLEFSELKKLIYVFKKDMNFFILNSNTNKVWKKIKNFSSCSINHISLSYDQKFLIISFMSDEIKILFKDSYFRTENSNNLGFVNTSFLLTRDNNLLFLTDDKNYLTVLKASSPNLKYSSSSSISLESLKTLSSNDLEKKTGEQDKNKVNLLAMPSYSDMQNSENKDPSYQRKSLFGLQQLKSKDISQIQTKYLSKGKSENFSISNSEFLQIPGTNKPKLKYMISKEDEIEEESCLNVVERPSRKLDEFDKRNS